MRLPQFGIFAQGTVAHEFIEFDLRPDVDKAYAGRLISQLEQPAVAAGGVNLVIAFGPDLWRRLAPEDAPASLRAFPNGRQNSPKICSPDHRVRQMDHRPRPPGNSERLGNRARRRPGNPV